MLELQILELILDKPVIYYDISSNNNQQISLCKYLFLKAKLMHFILFLIIETATGYIDMQLCRLRPTA